MPIGRTKQRRKQLSKEKVEYVLIRLDGRCCGCIETYVWRDDDYFDDMELLDAIMASRLHDVTIHKSEAGAYARVAVWGDCETLQPVWVVYSWYRREHKRLHRRRDNQVTEVADECLHSFNRAFNRAFGIENASLTVTGDVTPTDDTKFVGI